MRHRVKGRKLGRTASHRKATLNALATALFRHKKIKTTLAKAKEARSFSEVLITKAKTDTVHSRRDVARFIKDRDIVKELFNEIAVKAANRPGGYTRVVKLGHRLGDAAEMAILELVDYSDGATPVEAKPKAEEVVEETPEVKEAEVVEEKAEETTEEPKAEEATEEKKED